VTVVTGVVDSDVTAGVVSRRARRVERAASTTDDASTVTYSSTVTSR
jgi:hypothetical protein